MFNPKVTIIIPVYNWSNYLWEAIKSALNQTYKNIEILVINDWSTDNWETEKISLSFGDKIKYIYKENGWVATALNLWIEKASWEYISWLSHDDLYYPNKIEEEIKILEWLEDKNTVIYWNIDNINNKSEITNKSIIDLDNINEKKFLYQLLTKHIIHWCALLIPKKIFNEIWNFDNSLKTVQDYDMWFRIYKKCNYKKTNNTSIKLRQHEWQDSRHPDKFILMMKEEYKIYWDFIKYIWIKKIYESYSWSIWWFIKDFMLKLYFKIHVILPIFIVIWRFKLGRIFIAKIRQFL